MIAVVLASASPARKKLLEAAGVKFSVHVSGVDEEDAAYAVMAPSEMVLALAIVKAHTVRQSLQSPAFIIGCDSTFELDGKSLGKPLNVAAAKSRAREISGRTGTLHTGHCFLDTAQEREISLLVSTQVTFSQLSDEEIDDYVATGEPLNVAGGFTLDGLSSPFIAGIHGDYTNVIGLSMPALRAASRELGYIWPEFKQSLVSA